MLLSCRVLLPRHEEPRYHAFVDRETQQAVVQVIFQQEHQELKTAQNLRALITEELFLVVLNNRLFRISRWPEAPFYAASVSLVLESDHPVCVSREAFECDIAGVRVPREA